MQGESNMLLRASSLTGCVVTGCVTITMQFAAAQGSHHALATNSGRINNGGAAPLENETLED
jgi:hypothetical protein